MTVILLVTSVDIYNKYQILPIYYISLWPSFQFVYSSHTITYPTLTSTKESIITNFLLTKPQWMPLIPLVDSPLFNITPIIWWNIQRNAEKFLSLRVSQKAWLEVQLLEFFNGDNKKKKTWWTSAIGVNPRREYIE